MLASLGISISDLKDVEEMKRGIQKYALSVVEASLPGEKEVAEPWDGGFNSCRAQTLENALRIGGGGENQKQG
jgi:hypothetical protein